MTIAGTNLTETWNTSASAGVVRVRDVSSSSKSAWPSQLRSAIGMVALWPKFPTPRSTPPGAVRRIGFVLQSGERASGRPRRRDGAGEVLSATDKYPSPPYKSLAGRAP